VLDLILDQGQRNHLKTGMDPFSPGVRDLGLSEHLKFLECTEVGLAKEALTKAQLKNLWKTLPLFKEKSMITPQSLSMVKKCSARMESVVKFVKLELDSAQVDIRQVEKESCQLLSMR
jgi:hypothetical protein